jgi:DNA helicase-2/ATP-dependent DNA helicase PcrA
MTFIPSPQQQGFFDWVSDGEGNALVEAVAGAGKTTTIVKALDLMSGYVFLGAYNSKMAKELKERVAGRKGVFASTFHSAGYKQLRFTYGQRHALRVDATKVAEIVNDIIQGGREDLRELAGAVVGIVSMAKQRGFGAMGVPLAQITDAAWLEMIAHFGLDENLPENARMDQVVAMSRAVLNRSNLNLEVIDYDDMVYLPLQRDLRMLQNDWVLIDEAQDTNPTRRALAKKMLKPGGRLVAVGDPHQAIFGFTGADNDSLSIIEREFNCARMPLTVTYRCPKAVVEHARNWVSHITAHETAPEGEVLTMDYDADFFADVQAGDAVLCRQNKYLVRAFFQFVRDGKAAKIEGRAVGQGLSALAGKWKIKTLDALADRLESYRRKEIEKAIKNKQEQRADQIDDQVETLFVLIERAKATGVDTVEGLRAMIDGMFADDVSGMNMIVLCSAHRSKGLEWNRVFLLGRDELMPSPFARQAWQAEQERNLIYVAVTRAKQTLVEVRGVQTEADRNRVRF